MHLLLKNKNNNNVYLHFLFTVPASISNLSCFSKLLLFNSNKKKIDKKTKKVKSALELEPPFFILESKLPKKAEIIKNKTFFLQQKISLSQNQSYIFYVISKLCF